MKRFRITGSACEECGGAQELKRWRGACPACGGRRFRVEIERSAWGLESFEWVDLIPRPALGRYLRDPVEPFWRTQSFLTCSGVSGAEIAAFLSAPMEARRSQYVGWKRRELEAGLTKRRRVCARCRVVYTIYRNAWNSEGYCSRTCRSAAARADKNAK